MRILDVNGNEITSPDLSKGKLVEERRFVRHHEAVEAVEEVGHWEITAEYPNGGRDVVWAVDVPGAKARLAWDEYETVLVYVPYTEAELEAMPPTVEELLNALLGVNE